MYNLKKISDSEYILPKEGKMLVDGLIIANEALLEQIKEDKALDQVKNVATLPGIVNYSIAMPDIHLGYGFPIGGVAAMDVENGVISPGGVGYDINCGVRIATLPVKFKELKEQKGLELLKKIYELVPSGVGYGQRGEKELSNSDYNNLCINGAKWAIEQGFGIEKDLENIESLGKIENASMKFISQHAKDRGKKQIGSLGSGNHFIEIGEIETIFDEDVSKIWGIEKGYTYIIIHSGSRGFGHQVCQDTLNYMVKKGYGKDLVDRQLINAKILSDDGKRYLESMAAAANFAFNNRQVILHLIRVAIKEVLNIDFSEVKLIYDVCHNIAKIEEYEINGKLKKLCVHRKGATRAFGKNNKELNKTYQQTGQPVLIPGDMGRASYLMKGLGNTKTFCSCAHGAGRMKSRKESSREWKNKDLKKYLKSIGIDVLAKSYSTISEEMPDAYKDVESVAESVNSAKIASKIARLKPSFVIKG
ncbi:MAG: RNA-splicing ligase RtcB [Candidatus Anoxychlamydiales bacterium]|nr:RNA-splicing ligase RtcB [Candidatus Anoxychlamydiales bacterium]